MKFVCFLSRRLREIFAGRCEDNSSGHSDDDTATTRILASCRLTGGFPEFLRGDTDGSLAVNKAIVDVVGDGVPNRLEQPPQANQGWTATRVWRILRSRKVLAVEVAPDRGMYPTATNP